MLIRWALVYGQSYVLEDGTIGRPISVSIKLWESRSDALRHCAEIATAFRPYEEFEVEELLIEL